VAQPATQDGRLRGRLLFREVGKRRDDQAKQGVLGLWLGCARSPAFDASAFPTEVRSLGLAVEKSSLRLSSEVEERFYAQTIRSSAT
jgi:hypothetical protein